MLHSSCCDICRIIRSYHHIARDGVSFVSDCYSSSSEVVKIMGTAVFRYITILQHNQTLCHCGKAFPLYLVFDLYQNYVDVTFKINHFCNSIDV